MAKGNVNIVIVKLQMLFLILTASPHYEYTALLGLVSRTFAGHLGHSDESKVPKNRGEHYDSPDAVT